MKRIIVTGANGAGKSHFARRLQAARPEVPILSFDSIKLTRDWVQRPQAEIRAALAEQVHKPAWILEGGPSMLPQALGRADALIWLDPPLALRAWRLLARPWKGRGQTRAELPAGNPDYILVQYRFAWRSLRKDRQFRQQIVAATRGADCPVISVTSRVDEDSVLALWRDAGSNAPDLKNT